MVHKLKFSSWFSSSLYTAAGLAMETSKVESVVRNQAEAKMNQLERKEPAGTLNQQMVCALVIISSRLQCIQQEAKAISSCEEKRKR
ncbi:hypothetical protein F511_11885 [Dorcoceras hygrometricum]|uniref:Uncharacterized protein n=1 Tax=Dorcoceras hygrometricum TaxID=472368 RepID=A0A2Z7DGV3_9LAMI|nr:hypothetical protein F511_11885 [Dorcoceras hygrometricum]